MKYLKYGLKSLALLCLCFMLFSPHSVFAFTQPSGAGAPSAPSASAQTSPTNGQACDPGDNTFLGLVPWYQYLKNDFRETVNQDGTSSCGLQLNFNNTNGEIGINEQVTSVSTSKLDEVWLVGLAIFEDLLRVAGLAAVAFVIYGGFRYTTSQGSPEQTGAALATIIHALVGLAIAVIAATSIAFIASQFGK